MNSKYRWIAVTSGLLFVVFLMWYFHTIVFYILAAAVIALIGKPLVRLIRKIEIFGKQVPMWLASALTLLVVGIFGLSLAGALIPILIDKLNFLASYDPDEFMEMLRKPMNEVEVAINSLLPEPNFSIKSVIANQIKPILSSDVIGNAVNTFTTLVVDLIMAVFSVSFIAFFFLKDEKLFSQGVLMLFPKRYEENIARAMASITNLLVRYFIGICIESAIKLVIVAGSLYMLGFEWNTAMIIGLITAILNVIPYIGPIVGGLIAFAITTVSPVEGVFLTTLLMQVGVVLLVFQLIDNIILQPYIYSSSVKAEPLEIFLVILMAGYMAGIIGMLLAIPAYTVLRVIAKEFFNNLRVVQKLTENI